MTDNPPGSDTGIICSIDGISKTYDGGFKALETVSLDIKQGEILALLGPNGAGKTTLISIICGIVNASGGSVRVGGYDVVEDYRQSRGLIGLVPQEVNLEPFETVNNTVSFSRGLFGKPKDPGYIENVLRRLSLWDKRKDQIVTLSGGMKRRVLIAKALSHEPRVLFLDEPTAGVDVELRKDMWDIVRALKADGVTIILTTHYIEEAEAIADRVGIIDKGKLLLVEEKSELMQRLGTKQIRIELDDKLDVIPDALSSYGLEIDTSGDALIYTYDPAGGRTGITSLFGDLKAAGLVLRDVRTHQSSLEEIFVDLIKGRT
ncbi:ABC transporter ATP-binding protein [Hoeflea prorocentri]|uniref:ABC transporter ATP-binding protein n=1 Tax=Hoeflea prorocentri TaxID=1922333 RepID=A0A9X3UGE7_9HYPH|nr:ABC transporter ATP-binding protein [Hoeflea prorocentri]MCY6380154.1 ABC transporter ATP-binding protein [Hoeflea prorocentri]MDA5397954.1 ABC transporter ATP-binding protein [Hoeflea prorocentri]